MSALTLFVTGAASGIGAQLTGRLLRAGHRVVAADVQEAALAARAKDDAWPTDKVLLQHLDVRKEDDWETALNRAESTLGALDVMMNVAGVLLPGYAHEVKTSDLDLQVDVNVKGVILGTRAAAKRMVRRGRGHIVNIGSLCSLAPIPGLTVYSATKFAVRGFTLAAAEDLRPLGIKVTVVMPDAVATPMLKLQEAYDEAALAFSGSRPLQPEEVVRVLVEQVLPKQPLEVTIPDGRGAIARAVNSAPQLANMLLPIFRSLGKRNQERIRRQNAS
jgi:3-oxoacyl-[acyl-carrier protein] reductase